MRIMAFDCSIKSTGWAAKFWIGGDTYNVASGTQSFEIPKDDKYSTAGKRFCWFNKFLSEMFSEYDPQVVVCEQPHFRGGRGTEALVGLCTRVEEHCAIHGIPYQQIHSGTLKKWATGSGKASKDDMIGAARKRWSHYNQLNDPWADEADALMMLDWGIENIKSL